ncbi:hypothetical protein RhiJN_24531 [Ceratobasidium sp. AG-Ba]|nr:hypothetical protein RhiJN_24531 [Ceratobasidium sp. AG-Ba]
MSQWGSHMCYVPPVNPDDYNPIPPLQPHFTGLTNLDNVNDQIFMPQDTTPITTTPPETDNPLIILNTLLNEFRMFRDDVTARLNYLEGHAQANMFTRGHFNGLQTDLQTILTQLHGIPRQSTGTNCPPPPPPGVTTAPLTLAPCASPATVPTLRVKLAKPDKFDGVRHESQDVE